MINAILGLTGRLRLNSQELLKMSYYAVRVGRNPGIYRSWDDCKREIDKFPKARYKKFSTQSEAASFVNDSAGPVVQGSYHHPTTHQNNKGAVSHAAQYTPYTASTSRSSGAKHTNKATMPSVIKNSVTGSVQKPYMAGKDVKKSSGLQKEIASRELDLFKQRLAHMENEERLQLQEMELQRMKQTSASAKKSAPGKMGKSKSTSGRHMPYSRPHAASSCDWKQNRKTQLIDIQDVKNYSTTASMEDRGGAVVYTDGACVNNGQGNPKAGIGVYWGPNHQMNVSERLMGRQTNNRAEIQAAVKAAQQASEQGLEELTIRTDSQFMINSMTKWLKGWKKNGWKTASGEEVKNRQDFEDLIKASKNVKINWEHVRGHQGNEGNECADRLAGQGAAKPYIKNEEEWSSDWSDD